MLFSVKTNKIIFMSNLLILYIPFYLYFLLLKFNMLFISIKNIYLLLTSFFLKNHISLQFDRFIDLIVCDNLLKGPFRFELTYVFYSTIYSCRFGLKLFINDFVNSSLSLFTLSSLFSSAG